MNKVIKIDYMQGMNRPTILMQISGCHRGGLDKNANVKANSAITSGNSSLHCHNLLSRVIRTDRI